jgi:hypothetical protein
MRIEELINETQLNELDWKKIAAAGALGAAALGAQGNPLIDHPKVFGEPGRPEAVRPVMSTSASRNEDGSITISYDGKEYQAVMYNKDEIQPRLPPKSQQIVIPMAQLGIRGIGRYIGTVVGDKIYIAK